MGWRARLQRFGKYAAGVVILVTYIFSPVLEHVAGADMGSWTEGEYPVLRVGNDTVGDPSHPNYPCYQQDLVFQWHRDENNNYSPIPHDYPKAVCTTRNQFAAVSRSGYITFGGYAYPAEDYGGFADLTAIPNSGKYLWLRHSTQTYGKTAHFVNNFGTEGIFTKVGLSSPDSLSGWTLPALGYEFETQETNPALLDGAGRELHINEFNFSSNGEWMIAEAINVGIVRIRLSDLSTQLVSTEYVSYGSGYSYSINLAISNDGNFAITSSTAGRTYIFDLSGCLGGAFSSSYSRSVNAMSLEGCRNRDLSISLREQLSVAGSYSHLTFDTDAKSIRGVVRYRQTLLSNTYVVSKRMTLSLPGYEPPVADYLAMGDSFSSGEGAYSYELGTDSPENKCHLSKISYPYLLARGIVLGEFHSVACSGAVIGDLRNQQKDRNSSPDNSLGQWLPGANLQGQNGYIAGMGVEPRVITISMAGNDVHFADKLKACISVGTCDFAQQNGRRDTAIEIADKYSELVAVYGDIKTATNNQARIYVLGYPTIVTADGDCGVNVHLNREELEFVAQSTHYLNEVIKAAARKAGVYYVDVEHALDNNNLCSLVPGPEKSVNGVTAGDDIHTPWYASVAGGVIGGAGGALAGGIPGGVIGAAAGATAVSQISFGTESFHPNAKGHQLMAEAVLAQTQGDPATFDVCPDLGDGSVVCPDQSTTIPLPNVNYFGLDALGHVNWLNITANPGYEPLPRTEFQQLIFENIPGQGAHFVISGLEPLSDVGLSARSDPIDLGTYQADADGVLNVVISMPGELRPGYHTIYANAKNQAGETVQYYQPVLVVGEEGDVDGDGIEDSVDPCGFVDAGGVDEDFDGIDDACDGLIDVPDDTTAPNVLPFLPDVPASGWYTGDTLIKWNAQDPEPSSGTPTQPADTLATLEGEHEYVSDESCDPVGNCSTGSAMLKIDKTLPLVSDVLWTISPKPVDGSSTLSVHVTDAVSGVASVEYYLDDADPGPGNANTMTLEGESAYTTFENNISPGVHKVTVRTIDVAGNWSGELTDYLVVYDPAGPSVKGRHWIYPKPSNGDILPGLIADGQEDKLLFGFLAAYDSAGTISQKSDFQLTFSTGKNCNNSNKAVNCHNMSLDSDDIGWLFFSGLNNSTATFQGEGVLAVDGAETTVTFVVEAFDGSRVGTLLSDGISVEIFNYGDDPNSIPPIYRASGTNVGEGAINIYQNPILSSVL